MNTSEIQTESVFFESISDAETAKNIKELLVLCDSEFLPPLSSRKSTVQNDFAADEAGGGVDAYFNDIKNQSAFISYSGKTLMGMMSFRENHTSHIMDNSCLPNVYISTIIVHPSYRRQGLTGKFYRDVMEKYPDRKIFTRTWSTNEAHIGLLKKLGFSEYARIENDRGQGIDTVYFNK